MCVLLACKIFGTNPGLQFIRRIPSTFLILFLIFTSVEEFAYIPTVLSPVHHFFLHAQVILPEQGYGNQRSSWPTSRGATYLQELRLPIQRVSICLHRHLPASDRSTRYFKIWMLNLLADWRSTYMLFLLIFLVWENVESIDKSKG